MSSPVIGDFGVQILFRVFTEGDRLDDEELAEQSVGVVISRCANLGLLQSERIDIPVLVWAEKFTLELFEMFVDELLTS